MPCWPYGPGWCCDGMTTIPRGSDRPVADMTDKTPDHSLSGMRSAVLMACPGYSVRDSRERMTSGFLPGSLRSAGQVRQIHWLVALVELGHIKSSVIPRIAVDLSRRLWVPNWPSTAVTCGPLDSGRWE